MTFTDEQQKHLLNFGGLRYEIGKIAIILDLDVDLLRAEFANPESEASKLYHKGKLLAEYKLQEKLMTMAMSGDLAAVKLYKTVRSQNKGLDA